MINSNLGPILHRSATIHPWLTDDRRRTTDNNHDNNSTITNVRSAKNCYCWDGRPFELIVVNRTHPLRPELLMSCCTQARAPEAESFLVLERPTERQNSKMSKSIRLSLTSQCRRLKLLGEQELWPALPCQKLGKQLLPLLPLFQRPWGVVPWHVPRVLWPKGARATAVIAATDDRLV